MSKKKTENAFVALMPRTVNQKLAGVTLSEFITHRSGNELLQAINRTEPASQDNMAFDEEIQYLIDTVTDLTSKKEEIKRLWKLVINIIKNESHTVAELQAPYLFPLVSITGEAGFSTELRKSFLDQLENALDSKLETAYAVSGSFVKGISDLLNWNDNLRTYQVYLGVGPRYGLTSHAKTITDKYAADVEVLKALSPATFIRLVEYIKYAYQHDETEYQIKLRDYYLRMVLQEIIVAKNNGLYQDYDRLLEDYYRVLYQRQPLRNWLFKNLAGYGEKPWKLCYLFIGINIIFALLFTFGGFDFKFQECSTGRWDRFVSFFYFNNTSMLTVGYGDIYPRGMFTKITVVLLQLSGFAISGSAVALFLKRILRF